MKALYKTAFAAGALCVLAAPAVVASPGKEDWNVDPAIDKAMNSSLYGYPAGVYAPLEAGFTVSAQPYVPYQYPYWGPPVWRHW